MIVEPDFSAFEHTYKAGTAQVVWTKLVADLETPVSAMLKLMDGRFNSFLLESVEDGAVRGRYSIIGVDPDILFRATGNSAEINRKACERSLNRFSKKSGMVIESFAISV